MKLFFKTLICVFLIIPTLDSFSQNTSKEFTAKSQIVDKIDSYLNASAINGFSGAVLVAINGEIILSKGYGWADRENKIPNSPSTVFNICSVTKQFTSSSILKLAEQ